MTILHKFITGEDLHNAKVIVGAADPTGAVTPSVIGELYWDNVAKVMYIAEGLAQDSWKTHLHTTYEPANANIQTHISSAHAPTEAQKNADITKAEIEAKLTGGISSHTHAYEPVNANIQTHISSAHAPVEAQKNEDITKAEIEAKLTGEITSHTHLGGGAGLVAHASTHASVGSDPLTPADIGASASSHTHNYEPADANIQAHISSAHAPSNAQANADITKAEIEAKLTGMISTHTHFTSGTAEPSGGSDGDIYFRYE